MKLPKSFYYLAAFVLASTIPTHAAEKKEVKIAGLSDKEITAMKDFYFSNNKHQNAYVTLLALDALERLYNTATPEYKDTIKEIYTIRYTLRNHAAELSYKKGLLPTGEEVAAKVLSIHTLLGGSFIGTKHTDFYTTHIQGDLDLEQLAQQALALSNNARYQLIPPASYLQAAINNLQTFGAQVQVLMWYFVFIERYLLSSEESRKNKASAWLNELIHVLRISKKDEALIKLYELLKQDKNGLLGKLIEVTGEEPTIPETLAPEKPEEKPFEEEGRTAFDVVLQNIGTAVAVLTVVK